MSAHSLGFPRIGPQREMKEAVESYWKGKLDRAGLLNVGKEIRQYNWNLQSKLDLVPVGDFSWYDHVLDMTLLLGAIPPRFCPLDDELDTYFHMARGRILGKEDKPACEMTKWFDTNYHYIVPELSENQLFKISSSKLFEEVEEAKSLGFCPKVILLGPLSYLWLAKEKENVFNKLTLLPQLVSTYRAILLRLKEQGVKWVQIDEPILVLDLNRDWQQAFFSAYETLKIDSLNLLLTTYFGSLGTNVALACQLPVAGLHIDLVRAPEQLSDVLKHLREESILSLGVIDGRNVWRTDLQKTTAFLKPLYARLKERLWIAGSCSFLHVPVDLSLEKHLPSELKSWLAFAQQKVEELACLSQALKEGKADFKDCEKALELRRSVKKDRVFASLTDSMMKRRSGHDERLKLQRKTLNLPLFPTTTIGSFPQTHEIRALRHEFKHHVITEAAYKEKIRHLIAKAIEKQEALGLDVLVHGEAERSDMVEYFAEVLAGFALTEYGWVQSYGSRCVKPPIIYGDVTRLKPMTVEWITFAQSLTSKPVKGMLTGPITLLYWSFARDDQSPFETAAQIALALRDEVKDLEKAGIKIIQIDEPAFREGLPLRQSEWADYLIQAVRCFKIASCGVQDETQIHTHMCYSEFNDIIPAIAELDADVITMETSRSDKELLKAFENYRYPNQIGPGVYDVHSPRVPSIEEMVSLIKKALVYIPAELLWINPDCGLKTRDWPETEASLHNMVAAAKQLRPEM